MNTRLNKVFFNTFFSCRILKNKIMADVITKKRFEEVLKNTKKYIKSESVSMRYRGAGFLEGILYAVGEIEPNCEFKYKDVEYIEIGFLGKEKIRTRKQTYIEYIIDKSEIYLKNK